MVQSKATTVKDYLAELPEDRRAAIQAVREVILENLDDEFEEGMQYGMIGYYVPHSVYPPGYHCDPRQPLGFACLASQKNHLALYLMCVYGDPNQRKWFEAEWKKAGKKLDMGKSCVRFKKLDDLALGVIGETIRRVSARKYIEICERALSSRQKTPAQKAAATRKAGKSVSVKKVTPKKSRPAAKR
ncbi:MAG TPA: DUF1801 domain-containing protein [Planctomycetaceae bacterium]|jgi:hypothetical protein|nr:DUF1801 domain-containing protein [Planctomycetaceae bacterium]